MFRLRGCSEDDTILLVLNYCMSFGIYSCDRPVLAHRTIFIIETYKLKCYISINNIILASGLQLRWKKCSNEPFHRQHLLLRMALDLAPTGIFRE